MLFKLIAIQVLTILLLCCATVSIKFSDCGKRLSVLFAEYANICSLFYKKNFYNNNLIIIFLSL